MYAAIPNRQGISFVKFWKPYIFSKKEKLQLKASPKIGYSMGPMRIIKKFKAFAIADCIVDWAASGILVAK
ncbi:unnamed protein product [Orchesella dallaii]|uniref:Uncharacterized protein n=1 Tax=Orchesella dallaii TaxID=48710 RepID=A0ABP1RW38_9HEXA